MDSDVRRIQLLNDTDYRAATRPPFLRWMPQAYRTDPNSGRPVKEFVALGRLLADGFMLYRASNPPDPPGSGTFELLKLGPAAYEQERQLMERYAAENRSEWNPQNLESIADWPQFIDLGRQTWYMHLANSVGQDQLRELLRQHDNIFVKSMTKGHAEIITSADHYLASFGPIERVEEEALWLMASEVIDIAEVDAVIDGRAARVKDEWRHYIYRPQRVASTRAMECDTRRTSMQGEQRHERFADATAASLADSGFATTYVLDTATLADGQLAVTEANYFFSSGIYDLSIVPQLADAILRWPA